MKKKKKTYYRNYFWRVTYKAASSDSDKDTDNDNNIGHSKDFTRAKFIFGQGHKTLGFLVVSILSLEVTVD
jgi:hypothetical protein